MDKPAAGFYHAGQLAAIITLLLPLFALVPRSASTFAPGVSSPSILRFIPIPAPDNDTLETRLPGTADYRLAANQFLDHPVLYPRTQGLYRANWIADQPDTHYGLQILSTSSLERLADFCKKHQICAQSAYLQVEVKKQRRYRLIHGSFSSKQAAERASASLSASLRSLEPWPRSYRQLKQAING